MNNLSFSSPSFSVLTVGKGDRPERAYSKIALHPGECVALETHDEVPCFYGKKGSFLAGEIFSADSALDGSSIEEVKKELSSKGINPEELEVYLAPCLTFSHTIVDEKTIEKVIGLGYREACKRTDGVDFLDVPLIVLIQFRRLGVKMENIRLSSYDTSENPSLLYSKSNGDFEKNLNVATLH